MFFKNIHKRERIVLLIVILCFIIIIGKVFYIQVIDYNKLSNLASSLWSRNLPIEPDRGRIYTNDGTVIADNLTTVSLVFIPNQVKDKDKVATDIANILNVDKKVIEEHLYKKSSIERVHPEGRRLSYEIADKINSLNYDGVYLVKESKRYYPYNNLMSHILGFVGIDNQGLSGLELQYDTYLTGASGAIQYFSDAKGNRLERSEVYVEPEDGMDIYLTVNYEIQAAVERELDNAMTKYNADGAWSIVMDPNSGEILAMSSRPNFNPNHYQDYTTEELNRNYAIWASYEPGSTFKIVTLATSVNEKTVDLVKDTFYDSGSVNVDGARIKCWKRGGHGAQTFLEVVQNSCNPGFVELGNRLGKEKLFEYINNFGFGKKTGIDLNGEASGILFNLNKVGPVELATTAFGQGVSVTAIQQITAVSAAINGGTLYKPYIVKRITEHETGEIIEEHKPTVVRKVISEEASEQVRYALESVVALGTGRNAYIENYRVGGKTGTSEDGVNTNKYVASFLGVAPISDPTVIVLVTLYDPKGEGGHQGGVVAAPVGGQVLSEVLPYLELNKDDEKEEDIRKQVEVPNVEGLTIKEATKILKDLNLSIQIENEPENLDKENTIVREQVPKKGIKVYEGTKVIIKI